MPGPEVIVVPTGAANIASVVAAIGRAGGRGVVTLDPRAIEQAQFVVLPGVGAFGAAMASLRLAGIDAVLRSRIEANRSTLCICLGMQVLFEQSAESLGVEGLGIVRGGIDRLQGDSRRRVPNMGWCGVRMGAGDGAAPVVVDGTAYFAHSYACGDVGACRRQGWDVAVSDYGGEFASAISRVTAAGCVLACQFHPELSGAWGDALIAKWLGRDGVGERPAQRLGVRVIPCLDVRDGRVVKGIRFEGLRDAGDPAELAAAYCRQGADELVMLDVSAGPQGRRACMETIKAIRRVVNIPLCVGGGVRAVDDAKAMLDAGADKVGVNSAAVRRPELIGEMAEQFGRQCVVVAVDARRCADTGCGYEVVIGSGKEPTGLDSAEWVRRAERLGAGEVLLTSVDRDGTRSGYDTDLLSVIRQACGLPLIASGGASGVAHMVEAVRAGADAVLAASIFHDAEMTVDRVKRELGEALLVERSV